ncbi:MAG: hypothetical protein ACRDTE_31835 [Pseudonocardiaceae bacterium]
MARYWHARGALPSGAVEAMEFEVAWLLKETDARRRPQMPADRAMRVAKRLGAFTMFRRDPGVDRGADRGQRHPPCRRPSFRGRAEGAGPGS